MIRINTSNAKATEIITFENMKTHFIATLSENSYSKVTFGEILRKTKDICFGNV